MGLGDSVIKMGFPPHRAAHAAAKLSLKADPGDPEQCLRSAPVSARQSHGVLHVQGSGLGQAVLEAHRRHPRHCLLDLSTGGRGRRQRPDIFSAELAREWEA